MQYYVDKTIEHRLEEARRKQVNLDFVREARAIRQQERTETIWSRATRFTNWIPLRVISGTRDGGAG